MPRGGKYFSRKRGLAERRNVLLPALLDNGQRAARIMNARSPRPPPPIAGFHNDGLSDFAPICCACPADVKPSFSVPGRTGTPADAASLRAARSVSQEFVEMRLVDHM